MKDSFKDINRFQKVPCIVDRNDFKLSESVAIVRYVSRENSIDDHWYPKDNQKRARVDEYLEWQHTNTRMACVTYFRQKWMNPILFGKIADPKDVSVSIYKYY